MRVHLSAARTFKHSRDETEHFNFGYALKCNTDAPSCQKYQDTKLKLEIRVINKE